MAQQNPFRELSTEAGLELWTASFAARGYVLIGTSALLGSIFTRAFPPTLPSHPSHHNYPHQTKPKAWTDGLHYYSPPFGGSLSFVMQLTPESTQDRAPGLGRATSQNELQDRSLPWACDMLQKVLVPTWVLRMPGVSLC